MSLKPSYYIYLVSSLPALQFGMKSPISFDKFLATCRELLSEKEAELIASASISGNYPYTEGVNETLHRWWDFDTSLRNELVKIRAPRKKADPYKYLRMDGHPGHPAIYHAALAAHRSHSVQDAEKILDSERWKALDEFTAGHYFDLDFLIAYAHKLLILKRWETAEAPDREAVLEEALA